MNSPEEMDRLREAGLRSTPQRRAILRCFRGGVSEHLSAEDVFAQVAAAVPGIGRGTIYATLAEFTELGLLSAFGGPDPIRYETNTAGHAHFRCVSCMRIFDVAAPEPDPTPFHAIGKRIKTINVVAEGHCDDCEEFAVGLSDGAADILTSSASARIDDDDLGAAALDSPLGPIMLAATAAGLVRVAFEDHADFRRLADLAKGCSNGGGEHLDTASESLSGYLADVDETPACPIDWDHLAAGTALKVVTDIPWGGTRSYHLLGSTLACGDLGRAAGTNPVPIFVPCHRIVSGRTVPNSFVGGAARREWLLERERRRSLVM